MEVLNEATKYFLYTFIIIDLLKGKDDIDNKLIKTVGNADLKIYEDSLRILRAIRFATVLDFNLDNDLEHPMPPVE